jgi:hypothetical protein
MFPHHLEVTRSVDPTRYVPDNLRDLPHLHQRMRKIKGFSYRL